VVVETQSSRRRFLQLASGGLAAAAGLPLTACSKKARPAPPVLKASQVDALLPQHQPLELVAPELPGFGAVPSGYLHYPARLVDAVPEAPGNSGVTIRTISPFWGPTPPGVGRNAYVAAVNRQLGIPLSPSVQDGNRYADKLSAVLGARDVPDLTCVPSWEVDRIPRFPDAVRALFADLTELLRGNAVQTYPMLATLPSSAWRHAVWSDRLAAVPFPADGPFPWALFYRKDLCERSGVSAPRTIDELYTFGKRLTRPDRGVWAFGNVSNMVQMFFKCPNSKGGWRRRADGGLEHKFEMAEYRQALEFTTRLYREGLVHPDLVASRGADAKQLFSSGRILAYEDGLGAWRAMQSDQAKVTPGFDMQPVPIFSAVGGPPLAWYREEPLFYTFVKKGLGLERTRELLRVLNWCAAPFGSQEYELCSYGVEGQHFTRGRDNSPIPTELGRREICNQYLLLGGRCPVVVQSDDVPSYVQDLVAYGRASAPFAEVDPFRTMKVQLPARYSKNIALFEDKMTDIQRSRRALGELNGIVTEWRTNGGDECRALLEKALLEQS
jgi:putative aldouronate transport system substrate-binding protein